MQQKAWLNCLISDRNIPIVSSYNAGTGVFTVPSSGDGWFFFSIYMSVDYGEFAHLEIEVNDDVMCTAQGDNNESGASDAPQATCSAVVYLAEGKNDLDFTL